MGLFNKKSDYEKECDKILKEICGGFSGSDKFIEKSKEHKSSLSNVYPKIILKWELMNKTLSFDNVEARLDEILDLDSKKISEKVINCAKEDTSNIHSNEDLKKFLNSYEIKKQKQKDEDKQKIEDEKQARKEENEKRKQQRLKDQQARKQQRLEENEENEKKQNQRKIDTFGATKIDGKMVFNESPETPGTTFNFDCIIREERFHSNTREETYNQSATGVIYDTYFEFNKTGVFLKSDLGKRKVFYRNVISVDLDKSGYFHITSAAVVRMRDGEIISLESALSSVIEPLYEFLHIKWELYQERQEQSVQITDAPISNADELLKYAELYEKGLLTKEEFEAKKKELL